MVVAATVFFVLVLFIASIVASCRTKSEEVQRLARVKAKYSDPGLRQKITQKCVWVGMTSQQLQDSWGKPSGVSHRVLKTKVKETYRYGSNRYGSSVYLDNGIVTGWRQAK
jgi:hypothetical protein